MTHSKAAQTDAAGTRRGEIAAAKRIGTAMSTAQNSVSQKSGLHAKLIIIGSGVRFCHRIGITRRVLHSASYSPRALPADL